MSMTGSDILHDADLFRAAYPSWPSPEDDRHTDPCPFCHARPGKPCRIFVGGRYGRVLRFPHKQRPRRASHE